MDFEDQKKKDQNPQSQVIQKQQKDNQENKQSQKEYQRQKLRLKLYYVRLALEQGCSRPPIINIPRMPSKQYP